MAPKDEQKPKKRLSVQEQIEQIDARNRSNLGYKASDFGITAPQAIPGLGSAAITFGPGGVVTPKQTLTSGPARNTLPVNTPSSAFLTQQERDQINTVIQDPKAIKSSEGPIEAAKTFLGNLFDTSDTYDAKKQTPDNPTGWTGQSNAVETVWDSFLGGLGWGYNRLSQLTVAGLSGLPGGTRTLTWDEANDVSVGQIVVGGIGESLGRVRRGEGSAGDLFAMFATPINQIGSVVGSFNADSPLQQAGFDITSVRDRQAFESGPEKFFSGVTDFGFTFADPLILGGKLAKTARIKFIDRPLNTEAGRAILAEELAQGGAALAGSTTAKMPPSAMFVNWAMGKEPTEILRHKMMRYATNPEAFATAMSNAGDYDTAALLYRYANNDLEAGALLFEKRADLVDAMARTQREQISRMYALHPDRKAQYDQMVIGSIDKAQNRLLALKRAGKQDTQEYRLAQRFFDNINQTWEDIGKGKFDPIDNVTPEGLAAGAKVFAALMKQDDTLAKAMADETEKVGGIWGSFVDRPVGMPGNTMLGRAVEASRQRRAQKGYEAAAGRGAAIESGKQITRKDGTVAYEQRFRTPLSKGYWKRDEFNQNGFTRTVRLWRWMGEENPVGYITTRGLGAQGSWREMEAVLNDISAYSGKPRVITLADGTTREVGGLARKQELLRMYMEAVQDGVKGADEVDQVVDRIEGFIHNDIMAWHGIPDTMSDSILSRSRQARADVIESIKNRKFFVGDGGDLDATPWLEQHLQNGTYMLNYRALEQAARKYDEEGLIKFADEAGQFVGENFKRVYSTFNDVWRPAVLMRLGYTLRNVAEGQFRAAAFTQSVDPLRYGLENGYLSARSSAARFMGERALKKAQTAARMEAAGTQGVVYPEKYKKWLGAQIVAREKATHELDAQIRNAMMPLASADPKYRDWMVAHLQDVQDQAVDRMARLKNFVKEAKDRGDTPPDITEEMAALTADRDDAFKALQQISKIKEFTGANIHADNVMRGATTLKAVWEKSLGHREALDDPIKAVTQYGSQSRAKRRVFSKPIPQMDGTVLPAAFDPENPLTDPALSLLSSDGTHQSMLQLSMDMGENLFRAQRQNHYTVVMPGSPKYFEGYAVHVNNIKNSAVGSRVLAGKSDEEIAAFLRNEKEGREIMDFLRQGQSWNADDVQDVITTVRERIDYIMPENIRDYASKTSGRIDADALKGLMGSQDAPKIIGSTAEVVGSKNVMDVWRSATQWTMKWLGTLPEDTFVRQPFYGTRYTKVINQMYADLKGQLGEGGFITMKDISNLSMAAHKIALKDTKDWLYTIDRRTNLGTYGEIAIPFISAAQNSVTTVGRLIWNDPTTGVLLADLWRAPANAGWEDDNGDIIIPLPKSIIPDAIEQALGLSTMENWKINKSSLNVVVPESGFGLIPRPGPVVGVPVSEFMKRGWFGMSVESPEPIRAILGKEGADQFWNLWKAYNFGEGQGVAPDPLSLSMLQPPVAQKVIQMIQGEGNQQFGYYYNLVYRSMMADWAGGRRDTQPTPDEVMNQTRGFYMTRLLGNLLAFTPPQYESKLDPLIKSIRTIQQQQPEDASRIINETYGPILQMIGDFSNTKNVAGMMPTADAVEVSRKHADLINQVSPSLERLGDLSVLSMLTTGGTADALYDDSAYGWQFANRIPGVNQTFREYQTPEQSWRQSQVNAGWTEYLKMMDQIDAVMKERGVQNLRQAPDLKDARDTKLAQMAANPLYKDWWQDYKEFGSSRTLSAVSVMEAALSNDKFMAEYGNTPVWSAAAQYLYHRNYVLDVLKTREGSIDAQNNQDVRDYWDQARAFLSQNPEWAAVQNRFLNGDDNPVEPGVQIASYYVVPPSGE